MIQISKKANPNYLCKIVQLKGLSKHKNADRLQTVQIDFQTVVTGMDAKEGEIYIYFPVECKINQDFLSHTNSFRDSSRNADETEKGFFEDSGRVKAMKLRGEKSMGYIVPMSVVADWAQCGYSTLLGEIGKEFDTVKGLLLVEKFEVFRVANTSNNKTSREPKLSRLVEGQVHLHVDTTNLRKASHMIEPNDFISITYKTHGTSWWVGNVLVKKALTLKERIAKWFGVGVVEQVYDLVYGSRRVVKNSDLEDPKAKDHYFGYDLWEQIKNEVGDRIPKGYTLYGEMLGYDHNGGEIQKGYDYGCKHGQHKLEVYRVTQTTPDGLVTELSTIEVSEFCYRVGLTPSTLMYSGRACDLFDTGVGNDILFLEQWRELFITYLEGAFNDKDCFMCDNRVPEEGVVIRKHNLFYFEAYKLKSFRFLEWESKSLDKGVEDIESIN
jgi:hypothetical protein